MPTGKVKWYDPDKGFGFLTTDEGGDVFVRSAALPAGTETLRSGSRVEFGVVQGRKGDQALQLRVLDEPASVVRARRKPPEDMTVIVEDLIRLLDRIGNGYRRGRHPEGRTSGNTAQLLRALADELDT